MAKRRANGEGNIRKRSDGRWEGRFTAGYDPESGKRIIKNVLGRTQAEVKEKLKVAIAEGQRLDISKTGNYTVASWVRTWYEVYAEPRIRPNTREYYTNYMARKTLRSRSARTMRASLFGISARPIIRRGTMSAST